MEKEANVLKVSAPSAAPPAGPPRQPEGAAFGLAQEGCARRLASLADIFRYIKISIHRLRRSTIRV